MAERFTRPRAEKDEASPARQRKQGACNRLPFVLDPRVNGWTRSEELMDTHSRSFAKAISWRITGTIDTLLISLIITQSVKLAAAIGFTEVVTKSLLYYLHERAWLRIPYGRRPPQRVASE
jgi:uncharacterized membrane protein